MPDDELERFVKRPVRIALRQEPQMRGERLQPEDGDGAVEEPRRVEFQRLDLKEAEMLVQPRPPMELDPITRLQERLHPAAATAAHETKMAAMRTGHYLQDGARLTMPAGAQNDSFVAPFHDRRLAFQPGNSSPISR